VDRTPEAAIGPGLRRRGRRRARIEERAIRVAWTRSASVRRGRTRRWPVASGGTDVRLRS
jgi:hypothetical protein